ncbi:MAG: type I 3-dehydroquinate dehydratase [Bacteroidota bacterium]
MICVSIGKAGFKDALSICNNESLVEIRADLMNLSADQYLKLFHAHAEVVFTCRKYNDDDQRRIELYSQALQSRVAYVDFDLSSDKILLEKLDREIKESKSQLILSYHNYDFTPERDSLKKILKDIYEAGADIAKIACMVIRDEDLVNLLSLYRKPGKKVILGMGKKGIITRVAAVFMGAEFTFAFPGGGAKTAPGQLTRQELEEIFQILKT